MVARQTLRIILVLVVSCLWLPNAFCEENAFDKGAALYKQGRYQEAIPLFRSAYELGISKPNSVYYMAMCHQQLGDLRQARDSYKLVCTHYPNSALFDRSLKILKEIELRLSESSETSPATLYEKTLKPPAEPAPEKPKVLPKGSGDTFLVRFTRESDDRIYLDGTINGTKAKFLFDTGAGVTFCRQTFVDRAGVKLNWISESAIIPGATGEAPAKVAIVRIAVGNLVRENKIYVEQDRPYSYYPALDNFPIVGQSFFGDLSYQVDGRMNLITFKKVVVPKDKAKKTAKLGPGEVPFVRDGAHMIVKAKVNDRECDMIFDTGASQVVFADRHLAQCGLNRPVDATNSIRRGAGNLRDSYSFKVNRIALGPIERQEVNVAVLVNTKFSRPLLGQAFLEGQVYTVDPVRNVIRFETAN